MQRIKIEMMRVRIFFLLLILFFSLIFTVRTISKKNWDNFIYFDSLISKGEAQVLYLERSYLGLNDLAVIECSSSEISEKMWDKLDDYDEELNRNTVFREFKKNHKYAKNFGNDSQIKYRNFRNKNGYLVYTAAFIRSDNNNSMYLIKLKTRK